MVDCANNAIAEYGPPGASLIRIGRHDDDFDLNRFEIDIELAPGVILPTPHGTLDGLSEGWEDKAEDVDGMTRDVIEGLQACQPLLRSISDTLHGLRMRARTVVAGWQREGLPADLVDVRLAPYDHWRGDTVPNTVLQFAGLGERLERHVVEVTIETPAELEDELGKFLPELRERHQARTAMSERGATGSIDQLALNAIARFGDVASVLTRFSSEWRFWLPDDTAIIMRDGHVTAGSGGGADRIEWSRSGVTIAPLFVPQKQLDAAIGQPVSMLLEHDFLTPDIIVRQARSITDNGQLIVSIDFTQPRRLFCAITGRVWGDVDAQTDAPAIGPDPSGTVVPFRSRAS